MIKQRDRTIDLFKIFLVLGMVLCHSIQLIGAPSKISSSIAKFINLVTFPGFLFCFGYVVNIAYLKKDKKKIFNSNKCLKITKSQ